MHRRDRVVCHLVAPPPVGVPPAGGPLPPPSTKFTEQNARPLPPLHLRPRWPARPSLTTPAGQGRGNGVARGHFNVGVDIGKGRIMVRPEDLIILFCGVRWIEFRKGACLIAGPGVDPLYLIASGNHKNIDLSLPASQYFKLEI